MDALSAVVINKALDGLALRASATAQNIASASSRDKRTVEVSFETALRAAAGRGIDSVRDFEPTISAVKDSTVGQETRLDLELATASETALRYSALLDMLGRSMQIERVVVRGGQ